MLILITHILVAISLTVALTIVTIAAHKQRQTSAHRFMTASVAATVGSGGVLLLLNTAVLGHVCAMMSLFVIATLFVSAYYQKRLSGQPL